MHLITMLCCLLLLFFFFPSPASIFPSRLAGSLSNKGISSRSPPSPAPVTAALSVVSRVTTSVFYFKVFFWNRWLGERLGNVPTLGRGAGQFLQRVSFLGPSSRAFTLPSALCGASRTSLLALRTSGVWDCQKKKLGEVPTE